MNARQLLLTTSAVALISVTAGCSTWSNMDRTEKGTAVGATGGALAGAAVAGPVGAAVGAGIGGYAGHHETQPGGIAANDNHSSARTDSYDRHAMGAAADTSLVRSAQQALNDRGFNAGPADGQWGPSTDSAVRHFQRANRLAESGTLDQQTLSALGVSR